MAQTTYLQVGYSDGKMFEYSKEAKEGFVVHEVDGEVKGFRRYLDYGLTAIYKGVDLRLDTPVGDQLVLKFQEGIDWVHVQVNAYTQRDSFTDFAESIIRFLPEGGLEVGQAYRVWPYVMENEAGYTNRGFSFRIGNKDGDRLKPVLYHQKAGESSDDPNAIPALVWEERRGKNKPTPASVEAQTDFLYKVLTDAIARTSGDGTTSGVEPQSTPAKEPVATTFPTAADEPPVVGEDDDLPF